MKKPALLACVWMLAALPLPAAEAVADKAFGGAHIEEVYRVRLDRGDLLLESIGEIIRKYNIQDGAVMTAAGSLSECTYHGVSSLAEKPVDKFTTRKGPM